MVRSIWKPPYVHYSIIKKILKKKSSRTIIRTMSRSSIILQSFIGLLFQIYTGRSYIKLYIEEKMVGHKLGEFSFTRKVGKIHDKKSKKLKK